LTRAAFLLALLVALTYAARSFTPGVEVTGGAGTALAFGFLLLAALQSGHIFHALGLPHLTGFLLCGAVFGPEALGLLTPGMVGELALVKRVAVGLIALLAGCELNFKALKPRMKSIGLVSLFGLGAEAVLLFPLLFFLSPVLPVTASMDTAQRAVVCLVATNVLCALSPSVVMGILSETRAQGPLSELCLSIVVIADLFITVAFSLTSGVVGAVFPETGQASGFNALAAHLLLSIAAGAAFGAISALYIRRVGLRIGLFIFGVFFVVAEAGEALHLDPLLTGLSAGIFLENLSPVSGHVVIRETEKASMPTFAIFFAVVGAEVHINDFLAVAPYGVAAALTRALGIWVGARVGAKAAGVEPRIAKLLPLGLLPQAGVAIALANLVKNSFPPWGEGLAILLLGTIVVNESIGPVLFRLGLARAGEIGKRHDGGSAEHAPHAAGPPSDVTPGTRDLLP
jgi:Kef-type K+ transport system membrane component KefB